jgi:hypothetical protein
VIFSSNVEGERFLWTTTLLLSFSVNHSIRILQDYTGGI